MRRGFVLCVFLLLLAAAPAWAFVSTGDGGWVWQNPLPQGNSLKGVAFVDATHGWAVGDAGTILATSDGGGTWTAQYAGTTADLYGVCFHDASDGWAVGTGGTILTTSDSGAHWTKQSSGHKGDPVRCLLPRRLTRLDRRRQRHHPRHH